jgi:hypothetical protein
MQEAIWTQVLHVQGIAEGRSDSASVCSSSTGGGSLAAAVAASAALAPLPLDMTQGASQAQGGASSRRVSFMPGLAHDGAGDASLYHTASASVRLRRSGGTSDCNPPPPQQQRLQLQQRASAASGLSTAVGSCYFSADGDAAGEVGHGEREADGVDTWQQAQQQPHQQQWEGQPESPSQSKHLLQRLWPASPDSSDTPSCQLQQQQQHEQQPMQHGHYERQQQQDGATAARVHTSFMTDCSQSSRRSNNTGGGDSGGGARLSLAETRASQSWHRRSSECRSTSVPAATDRCAAKATAEAAAAEAERAAPLRFSYMTGDDITFAAAAGDSRRGSARSGSSLGRAATRRSASVPCSHERGTAASTAAAAEARHAAMQRWWEQRFRDGSKYGSGEVGWRQRWRPVASLPLKVGERFSNADVRLGLALLPQCADSECGSVDIIDAADACTYGSVAGTSVISASAGGSGAGGRDMS